MKKLQADIPDPDQYSTRLDKEAESATTKNNRSKNRIFEIPYGKIVVLLKVLNQAPSLSDCLMPLDDLPNIDIESIKPVDDGQLLNQTALAHKPRILLLYGSLRQRSFSRLVTEEAARILAYYGAETKTFNPSGLPLPDDTDDQHPKVQELRELASWSEGMVWCSPERHGAMTGIMKAQIDWIPLALQAVRPTQGKTLAVMQVCGGSQSFNAVNQMRILGRWMRMITIPNQSSVAKAWLEFDDDNRMKPSSYYDRIVDVMEELVKFTLLTRGLSDYLVDRYSERKESVEAFRARIDERTLS